MSEFEELPFEEQLAWIERETDAASDPRALVTLTSALPDVEPLCRLFDRLANAGAQAPELVDWFGAAFAGLPDPALQYLLGARFDEAAAREARVELARRSAVRWPLSRTTTLALLHRWLDDADPGFTQELRERAARWLESDGAREDRRWLFFLDGQRLARLAEDAEWAETIRETTRAVLDRLARAPKSLSQANAEALLARRVYANPGHFLFELMQNADDAGAAEWSVRIDEHRTVVVHDGAPFSFLDVVGICSIGMTTKSRDQIGLFGVGFKSVFEVTDRPRIHSGAFHFEIAHVSMPRAIAARSDESGSGKTTLVLPHHEDVDPRGLTESALAIPSETLMTLPHLRRFSVAGVGSAGESHVEERKGARISLKSTSRERTYEVSEETMPIEGGHSPVLVAASVGGDGSLLARAEPGLFAFLPTAERTGVPVLVQARFEVTVDRERLETGSERNRKLLAAAGRRYAALVERVASQGGAVLDALPVEREVSALVAPLADALRASLLNVPCLPGADGRAIAPANARIMEARLAAALAGLDLGGGARALASSSRRAAESAAFLGATIFADADLRELLRSELVAGADAPDWLGPDVFWVLGDSTIADESLHSLPLLVDGEGKLVTATEARAASPAWVALYAGVRPLVSTEGLGRLGERLLRRLALTPFESGDLARDLAARPELLEREEALLTALAHAAPELLESLSGTALFRGVDGGRYSAADGIARLAPRLEPLRAALASQLPLVSAAQERAHPDVVGRALPVFDVAELATAFDHGLTLEPVARRVLVSVLDDAASDLRGAVVRQMSALPLFEDVHGVARPLVGNERAFLPAHAQLPGLLPSWPWLARTNAAFVRVSEPTPFDARAVASGVASPVAGSTMDPSRLPAVIDWIGANAGELRASDVDALAAAAVWPDFEGDAQRLEGLRVGTSADVVNAFYAATGIRRVAHAATLRACRRLRLERALPVSDHEAVIADLLLHAEPETLPIDLVAPVLVEAVREVSRERLAAVLALPLFEDESGARRALGSFPEAHLDRCHRPGSFRRMLTSGPRPLLSETLEQELAIFLERVGPPAATVVDLVSLGAELEIAPGDMLEALLDHADELDPASRDAVGRLPLFESRAGEHRAAHELGDAQLFLDQLGAEQIARLGLGAHLMTDLARDASQQLGLVPRPPEKILVERVLGSLVERDPLAAQPSGLRTRDDLLAVLGLSEMLSMDVAAYPLALDQLEKVVPGPLRDGSAGVRTLAQRLPPGRGLADEEWASDARAEALLEPLGARAIATALAATCREELPRDGHSILPEPDALYAWIREEGASIEADEAARSALGVAHVVPSQRGTLRAPNELVLSAGAPDLGLAWGIADDVPADVALWLGSIYEMDRQQRRALTLHVLDGVDDAVESDDSPRVVELVRFLAMSLDAGSRQKDELEQRVRRLKIRARLRVPAKDGAFVKPRFGWVPQDETAALAEAFMESPPPRLGIENLDRATRALLAACGAAPDLSEEEVEKLLGGDGLRGGVTARAALARYVAQRAFDEPTLATRWKLSGRAWVPDRRGKLRVPHELLWPEPAARALFGESSRGMPDDLVVTGLPREAAGRLGFVSLASITLKEIAERIEGHVARPELIELLEDGLSASRFTAKQLAHALGDRIALTDDEGLVRPVSDVAIDGARELFGRTRGNASCLHAAPQLARALSVPRSPDLPMMLEFLEDRGEMLSEMSPGEREDLARHLPEVYRRLAERVRGGADLSLPPSAVALAIRDGERQLVSIADEDLRIPGPPAIAGALDEGLLDAQLLLETVGEGLLPCWLDAGVSDLLGGSRVVSVEAGRRSEGHDADAFHADLARKLGAAAGDHAVVQDALTATIAISLPTSPSLALSYRGERRSETPVTLSVDAVLSEDTLYLTPRAIQEPVLVAAAIYTDPRRRAALMRWLNTDLRGELERRARSKPAASGVAEAAPADGWVSRIKRFFGADDEPDEPGLAGARRAASSRSAVSAPTREDASLFRQEHQVRAQLAGTEGWVDARRQRPEFGFRFAPDSLPSPWMYAPKIVATRFDRATQSWHPTSLDPPVSRGHAGLVRMRGVLPKGDSVLPVPLYARLEELRAEAATRFVGPSGSSMARLAEAGSVAFELVLGEPPDASAAHVADLPNATASFVPDAELPEEVLDFVEELDDSPPLEIAHSIRDFVRRRYRYDPTYLEDAAVGRWLARVSRGRAHAHVASLHAAAGKDHLGAGVCYELNSLTCELLRRAGIPAGIATGWVFDGGSLSEPDHLWVIAFLETDRGEPLWLPIDASTTIDGRALRVPRRPPIRARPPSPTSTERPSTPRWERPERAKKKKKKEKARATSGAGRARPPSRRSPQTASSKPQRRKRRERRPPRAELRRLLRYLERRTGREITSDELERLERALQDPRGAQELVKRMLEDG